MFPVTDSSQTIIDCLMKEVNKYGIEIRMNKEVKQLKIENEQWTITFANNDILRADYVLHCKWRLS